MIQSTYLPGNGGSDILSQFLSSGALCFLYLTKYATVQRKISPDVCDITKDFNTRTTHVTLFLPKIYFSEEEFLTNRFLYSNKESVDFNFFLSVVRIEPMTSTISVSWWSSCYVGCYKYLFTIQYFKECVLQNMLRSRRKCTSNYN